MRRLNLTAAVDVNDDIGTKCLLPSSTQLLPIKWQIVYFIFFVCGLLLADCGHTMQRCRCDVMADSRWLICFIIRTVCWKGVSYKYRLTHCIRRPLNVGFVFYCRPT